MNKWMKWVLILSVALYAVYYLDRIADILEVWERTSRRR